MIVFDPGAGEPTRWHVCFCRRAARPWLERLPVGRYKHVRAFGAVASINTWIFFDPALDRVAIKVARGDAARALMAEWLTDADVIRMPHVSRETLRLRFGGWCVPQVKAVVGITGGALRPDALWRDCLRQGGEIVTADASADTPCADSRSACHAS
jgi:hypothetical protein